MSSTSTTWTTDTNTKSGTVQVYESNVSVLRITGVEDGDAVLELFSDQGDDNADKWRMWINNADNDLHFTSYTSGAWVDKLTIQDGGNIGIGTSSPNGNLNVLASGNTHVVVGSSNAGGAQISLDGDSNGDASGSDYSYIHHDMAGILNIVQDSPSGTNEIRFGTAGVEDKVVIDANGNVGIGTASPTNNLVVAGSGSTGVNIERYDTTGGNFANLNFMKSKNATVGSHTTCANNDNIGAIKFWGSDGTDFEEAAAIHCEVDNSTGGSATDMPGRLSFWTSPDATDAPVERMTIKSTGYIGIGTTAPATLLEVKGGTGAHGIISINTTDADNGTSNAILQLQENSQTKWQIYNDGDNSDKLIISDGNADFNMVIQQDGKVGIGTQVPSHDLSVNSGDGGMISLNRDDTAIENDNALGQILFGGDDPSDGTFNNGAAIVGLSAGAWDTNEYGAKLIFKTTSSGTNSLTEKMRIADYGGVGIGITPTSGTQTAIQHTNTTGNGLYVYRDKSSGNTDSSLVFIHQDNASDDQYALHVRSDADSTFAQTITHNDGDNPRGLYIHFNNSAPNGTGDEFLYLGDTAGLKLQVRSNGGIANYSANDANLSDERLKKDIVDAPDILSSLNSIKVRNFKYKDQTDDSVHTGLIAQEVESVISSLIDNSGDFKMIKTTNLYHMMLKAIQELSAKVTALESA